MNKILVAIAILISGIVYSQDTINRVKSKDTPAVKSVIVDTQRTIDSIKTAEIDKESIARGVDNLVHYQKEQKDKQKKKAILYIGLGIFFLVILIVGLTRRSKSIPGK